MPVNGITGRLSGDLSQSPLRTVHVAYLCYRRFAIHVALNNVPLQVVKVLPLHLLRTALEHNFNVCCWPRGGGGGGGGGSGRQANMQQVKHPGNTPYLCSILTTFDVLMKTSRKFL